MRMPFASWGNASNLKRNMNMAEVPGLSYTHRWVQ